jgi:ssDNA-binding Zn-finger/Zn-ribbon topoisomerase 1
MKNPIIISGQRFLWDEPNPCGEVVGADGEVNWMAAAFADPGCMQCPKCGAYLWNEGDEVCCPDCGHQFVTPDAQRRAERKNGGS